MIFVHRKNENASYGIIFSFVHIQSNLNKCQVKCKTFFFVVAFFHVNIGLTSPQHFKLYSWFFVWYILPYVPQKNVVSFQLERAGNKKIFHTILRIFVFAEKHILNSIINIIIAVNYCKHASLSSVLDIRTCFPMFLFRDIWFIFIFSQLRIYALKGCCFMIPRPG